MKSCRKTVALGAILGVLLLALPFQKYETDKLLPIRCLQAQRLDGLICILSEAGEGRGATWALAVEDLKKNAPGQVFFDTAEQAVFSDEALALEAAQGGDLRPAAEVFYRKGFENPEALYAYYSQHGSSLKMADLMGKEASPHESSQSAY